MEQKKYWQSFGELNKSDAYENSIQNEFAEDLPVEPGDGKLLDAKTPRRDFLKYLGFSTAAAMAAASCEMPVKKAIPYLNKPDTVVPGIPDYYASTVVQDNEVVPVVVKVRDGRPIKVEGNDLSTLTGGGTSARVQASVLNIYDTARLTYPMQNDGKEFKEVSTYEAFDKMVGEAFAGLGGAPVVLLTSSVSSPSTKQVIADFLAKYPGGRHVQYDALSYSGLLLANEASYGKRAIPSYHFENAKVIVSLGADFLGTWLSPVQFAHAYSKGRRVNAANPEMSKHIQFESMLSMTGANADERYVHRPSETGAVALNLLSRLGGAVSVPAVADARLKKGLDLAANLLKTAGGNALVVSGSNDPNVQIVVNAINEAIGANGKTINWSSTLSAVQAVDKDMVQLVADMNEGKVGALLIHDVNPAYDYFDAKKFADGIKKVKVTVAFNERLDETAQLCKYVAPDHHYLESWGDAEAKSGYLSF
ncbi:MAG: [Fe-S]-binding protein, partial [Sphingobacteriales bacterium]